MRLKTVSLLSLLLLGNVYWSTSFADPISNAAIISQLVEQLQQLEKQFELLDKTYTTHEAQLNSIKKLNQYNSGHYGFGKLHNSLLELQKKQSANTWKEALKGISGGNPQRYKELVSAYEKQHFTLNKERFSQGASPFRTERFEEERQVTQEVSIESEEFYDDINESLKRIHDLSAQIEKAENTKAAVDLNSRLLTEIAYLEVHKLKAQSLLNQLLATHSGSDLTDEVQLTSYLNSKKQV